MTPFISHIDIATQMAHLFACADNSVVTTLAEHMIVRHVAKDDFVYGEGRQPHMIYYIVSGKAKIVKNTGFGRMQVVRTVAEHNLLGYRAFFAGECYNTSCMAFEECVVAEVPFGIVTELAESHPCINAYFMHELASLVGYNNERIVSLTQKHIRGRLADTLVRLLNKYGTETDDATLDITMNRDDIASLSNMSTGNAIRTLSAFAQEGLIELCGRHIKIIDAMGLRRISEMG